MPILPYLLIVSALRWQSNLLSPGDDEARSLGIRPERQRMPLIVTLSLLTAATVTVARVIGWVGLVIAHPERLVLGSDNRVLL